jgi:hypothetical protein
MTRHLSIGIDSWIIQDGNYGDFAVGDTAKFALEFAGKGLVPSSICERSSHLLHTSVYRVRAKVVFVHPTVWVIDFGVLAYWEAEPPSSAKIGDWVEGDIFVGIDPFFYKEYLHKLTGIPNLYYNWKVEGVLREDTPWLSAVNERGGVNLSRDAARARWTEVQHTQAWEDDDGRSSYVLRCGGEV